MAEDTWKEIDASLRRSINRPEIQKTEQEIKMLRRDIHKTRSKVKAKKESPTSLATKNKKLDSLQTRLERLKK